MTQYRIAGPDGKTYEIEGPPGATREQVIAKVKEKMQAAPAAPKPFQNSVGRIPAPNPNAEGANPTEGMGTGALEWAGAGKAIMDTYRGLQQMGGGLADRFDPQNRTAAVDAQVNESRKTDEALMNTKEGMVGNIVGQAAMMALPVPGAAAVKGVQLLGKAAPVVTGAIRAGTFGGAQGVADGESRGENTAINAGLGAGGALIPKGLAAAGRKAEPVVDAAKKKALDTLEKLGIPVHLSQTMDSGFLKLVSSVANKLPFSGVKKAGANQQGAFNEALGRTMGLGGVRKLSDDVVKVAGQRIGRAYDTLFGRNTVKLDSAVGAELKQVAQQARTDLTPDKAKIVINQIEKFVGMANKAGEIPGRAYQNIRLGMKELEKNPEHGHLVREVRKVMEKAAEKSFKGNDAALLRKTNERYANKKVIEKALKQVSGAGEDVRPASLWPLVNGKYGSSSEMRELARAGQLVLKDGIPDSGTAQRDMVQRLFGLSGAGGAAAMAGILPFFAKAAAGGVIAGRALNSPTAARIIPGATSKTLKGAARLTKPAPQALPAALLAWRQQQQDE